MTDIDQHRKYLTIEEMVSRYDRKISVSVLAYWRSRGVGPKWLLLGRTVLYPIDALERWERGRWYQRLRRPKDRSA